jgi:hypothetical protein
MTMRVLSLFRNLLRRRAVEQELDDELRSSVEILMQEKLKGRLSPAAARRQALVDLNGTGFAIVGVLPRGFVGVQPGQPSAFYVPMATRSQFLYVAINSNFHWYVRLMARLRPGADDAGLTAALNALLLRLQPPNSRETLEYPWSGGAAA